MATTTLNVDGDISAGWDTIEPTSPTTHYDKIDEGTTTPSDTDYIETTTLSDVDQFSFDATPANHDLTSQIDLKLRAKITDSGGTAKIRAELFHTTSTAVTGNPKDFVGADFGGYGVGPATATKSWTGLSLTKAQMDSLEVKLTFLGS